MNREDKICLVLEGLINGVDYETGEDYGFSDTVIDSLKAVTASLECDKRNQYAIDSVESAEAFEKHFFEERLKTLPRISSEEYRQVNEVIGSFYLKEKMRPVKSEGVTPVGSVTDLAYQMFGINLTNVKGKFSKPGWFYSGTSQTRCNVCNNQFEVFRTPYTTKANLTYHYYSLVCIKCSAVIAPNELTDLKQRRELYEEHKIKIYSENKGDSQSTVKTFNNNPSNDSGGEGNNSNSEGGRAQAVPPFIEDEDYLEVDVDNPCVDCGCEIPQVRLDNVTGAVRCASCQSKFEKVHPESVARKAKEEGILTREGAKRMRAKQYGTNIHNKI